MHVAEPDGADLQVSLLSPGPLGDELVVLRWHGYAVLECPASLCANLLLSFSELSFRLGEFVLNLSAKRLSPKWNAVTLDTSCCCGVQEF